MHLRERLMDYSYGNDLRLFWRLFRLRGRVRSKLLADVLTFILNRMAHKRGGYIGRGAVIEGVPSLPHGLHGVYISRYARLGPGCRIYQNVTIGEVGGKAPFIGSGCLIGAGAVIIGGVTVGDGAKIGAGAVVSTDIPAGCTAVASHPRILGSAQTRQGPCPCTPPPFEKGGPKL